MNSRFHYPFSNASLGVPRRPSSLMNPMERRVSAYSEADADRTSAIFAKPTVLVVEDDDNTLCVLKNILETRGYFVLEAREGKQAVDIAEAEKLDLILLDLHLPRLNGLDVIRRLRENVALESLPIVIMTGYDPQKYRSSAIAAGCDDFLPKPIDFYSLYSILDYFVPLKAASCHEG
jgi:CheY-like chemotaxis protein